MVKKVLLGGVLLAAIAIGLYWWSAGQGEAVTWVNNQIAEVAGKAPELTPLQQKLAQGAMLIDVRTAREYQSGAAPGAVHVPLEQIPLLASKLTPDTPMVIYCAAGVRADKAVKWLKSKGFSDVTNGGGLHHVRAAL